MTLIPTAIPQPTPRRATAGVLTGPTRPTAAVLTGPTRPAGGTLTGTPVRFQVDHFVHQLAALQPTVAPASPALPAPTGLASLFVRQPKAKEREEALAGGHRIETAFAAAAKRTDDREAQAQAMLQSPAAMMAEARALAALSPADRAAYDRLAAATPSPCARLALRELLLAGKLTGSAPSAGGASLLTELDRLASAELAPGIDKQALLADVLIEVAAPQTINQGRRGTCAATAAQLMLAQDRPAELVRLLAGLASPAGQVTLADGQTLLREPGTERDDKSGRSGSSRLLQAAFMEFANGESVDYHNGYGRNGRDGHSNGRHGLTVRESDRLAEGLSGGTAEHVSAQELDARPALAERVLDVVRGGQPVAVGLAWGKPDAQGKRSGHKVVVTAVIDGRVYFTHGHGKVESMTIAEFEQRVKDANFPPR